jgi:hypothetical protein
MMMLHVSTHQKIMKKIRFFSFPLSEAGGDYSCHAAPLDVAGSNEGSVETTDDDALADLVREYFVQLRANANILTSKPAEVPHTDECGTVMFDTWIGTGLMAPSCGDAILDVNSLMAMFAFVCRDIVIAVDTGCAAKGDRGRENVTLFWFSETDKFDESKTTEQWSK